MGRVTGKGMVWEICNLDRRKKRAMYPYVWRRVEGMERSNRNEVRKKNWEQVESGFDFIGNKKTH